MSWFSFSFSKQRMSVEREKPYSASVGNNPWGFSVEYQQFRLCGDAGLFLFLCAVLKVFFGLFVTPVLWPFSRKIS